MRVTRLERNTLTKTDCLTPIQYSEFTYIDIISEIVFALILIYNYLMNFFKKMMGFGSSLEERRKSFKVIGTLFEVVKQTRNLKYEYKNVD